MAVRDDFSAGEVLAAADLNDTFASKLPYSYGTATPSTSVDGFLWYDSNSTPAATKFWDGSAFVPFGGKILQIVRGTDSTSRTTTSNSFVDASNSVTITPQKSDSTIWLIASYRVLTGENGQNVYLTITDSSNNIITGSVGASLGATDVVRGTLTFMGYSTPATTSATTYKVRFRTDGSPSVGPTLENNAMTAQLFAIEVSA